MKSANNTGLQVDGSYNDEKTLSAIIPMGVMSVNSM